MKTSFKNSRKYQRRGAGRIVVLVLVLIILGVGLGGMLLLKKTGPVANKIALERATPTVRVMVAELKDEQLYLSSQGEVKAELSTELSSRVEGQIIMVSPKLKVGGDFEENEVMLEVEREDYVVAITRMESSLADAKLALQQEKSRAKQALRDWAKLGKGKVPELVARKPQIASAEARLRAAQAEVAKAKRDLERTVIRAPYLCRVNESYVNLGATISSGMKIAEVYSIDIREIRVPIPLSELGYLDEEKRVGAHVDIKAEFLGEMKTWIGDVVRTEGKIDRRAMMMHLVVRVAESETQSLANLPPPGLFVRVWIKGRRMKNVVTIPRSALNVNHTVYMVDEDNSLKTVKVQVARTMKDTVLISSGIKKGDRIIISAIETPITGMKVEIEKSSKEQK